MNNLNIVIKYNSNRTLTKKPNGSSDQEKHLTVGKTTSEDISIQTQAKYILAQNSKIWLRQGYPLPRNTCLEGKSSLLFFVEKIFTFN